MTTTFLSEGTRHEVARDQIQQAAARLTPAHSETFSKNQAWFALVGGGLHYVIDLIGAATGHRPSSVETARLALDTLGFPVLCLAYGRLLTDGHPAHRE
ncbi:hypothetical protein PZB75_13770 [Streptomyces sp. AM 4-1-1]|uniref:hypothetical protein n=1 Tax=Streptomyces sp. AM 4-1-1 TaxID=3028710 RepID=UPI0023BA07BB|nr:hypothetical protein [Streptomyces sp. AM 4-1-1]WEH34329.1 hypothetical protein PZB75_13770 [Streptomyces sp. AM 4-1-1]